MIMNHPFLCLACSHRKMGRTYMETPTCTAYPEGIPVDILCGAQHIDPRPDDNGIQFDIRPGAEDIFSSWVAYWHTYADATPDPSQPGVAPDDGLPVRES